MKKGGDKAEEPGLAEKAKIDAPAKKTKDAIPTIEGINPEMLKMIRLLRGEDEKKAKDWDREDHDYVVFGLSGSLRGFHV